MRNYRALKAPSMIALLIVLSGCGGGGGSSPGPIPSGTSPTPAGTASPVPTATPTPPGPSNATIVTTPGGVTGAPGAFVPSFGDYSKGGQGQPIDGKTCDPTQYENYHVHFFLGLWVNGNEIAIPGAVGFFNPGPPVNGFYNAASCAYYIHTHDSSGIVHIEDPNPNNVSITQSIYTLKQFLDEWGIVVNANQFGPYSGPVRVFTSGQVYRGDVPSQTTPASDLTFFGTDPSAVPLYSYEVIDIEVGPAYPATLPNVRFYQAH